MTVGSMARAQYNMANIMTQYGSQFNSLYSSYASNKLNSFTQKTGGSLDSLNELLKSSALKNKSSAYKDMFSELYKNIYGISDDSDSSGMSSLQSIKTASADAGSAAMSIESFANGLKYGGEVDADSYKAVAQNFVDSYNAMIEKIGNSDSQSVLQQGVYMVNQAKVYSSALSRAGITLGSDNKLTLNDDLSKVTASNIKSTFGNMGFASKVASRARNINQFSGGTGLFTASKVSSSSSSEKVDNSGTLKELTSQIKDRSEAIGDYIEKLNNDNVDFDQDEYNELARSFIDSYNNLLSEAGNSDKVGVNSQGVTAASITKSYKYALQKAGFNVDKNGKLSLGDTSNVTVKDLEYAFKNTSYLEKINQKAQQASSLANSASAMSYSSNSILNYAYQNGSLFNVYA